MSKAAQKVSEIDRLIDLASDKRPSTDLMEESHSTLTSADSLALDTKDPQPSMWRIFLQLRVLLPYLARLLPLVERGLLGAGGSRSTVDTSHFDDGIAEIDAHHRDLANQLKSQTVEIKYLQEQLSSLSKSLDDEAQRQQESLASLRKLVKIWGIVIAGLLAAVLATVLFAVLMRPS